MIELIDKYLGEIILGAATTVLAGVWGIIRGFFIKIRKMGERIDDLETALKENTRSDEDLKTYMNIIISEKLKS